MRQKKDGGVGRHIAVARRQAGLTQEELASRLHVTRQTISNYESMRSQPDIQMLVQLWAGGLLMDTVLLALGSILFRLGQREAREEVEGQ